MLCFHHQSVNKHCISQDSTNMITVISETWLHVNHYSIFLMHIPQISLHTGFTIPVLQMRKLSTERWNPKPNSPELACGFESSLLWLQNLCSQLPGKVASTDTTPQGVVSTHIYRIPALCRVSYLTLLGFLICKMGILITLTSEGWCGE